MMGNEQTMDWCVEMLEKFPNNAEYVSLSGKRILFVTRVSAATGEFARSKGAAEVYQLLASGDRPTLKSLCNALEKFPRGSFERIFLDMSQLDNRDFVINSAAVFSKLRDIVTSNGAVFCALKVGQNDRNFDVQNKFVMSDEGWLPGREYLFDTGLKDWAVRAMHAVGGIAPQTDMMLLRLVLKRPSLLLICGKSMSGKTTLARELSLLDSRIHVSNDFIYTQLVRAVKNGVGVRLHSDLVEHLGDGSGQACGEFNRALEAVPGLLEHYLPHLVASIPKELNLVSVDFDLRTDEGIKKIESLLTSEGFSVWVVQRI